MAIDVVNEKTTWLVTVSFTDADGSAVTPDSGTYRIDDVATGTEITGDTAIAASGSSEVIEITDAENAIVTAGKVMELHRLTLLFTYDTDKISKSEYFFYIKNLSEVAD